MGVGVGGGWRERRQRIRRVRRGRRAKRSLREKRHKESIRGKGRSGCVHGRSVRSLSVCVHADALGGASIKRSPDTMDSTRHSADEPHRMHSHTERRTLVALPLLPHLPPPCLTVALCVLVSRVGCRVCLSRRGRPTPPAVSPAVSPSPQSSSHPTRTTKTNGPRRRRGRRRRDETTTHRRRARYGRATSDIGVAWCITLRCNLHIVRVCAHAAGIASCRCWSESRPRRAPEDPHVQLGRMDK